MSSEPSRLEVKDDGGVTHVGFLDANILSIDVIQPIEGELVRLVEEAGKPKMLLDFAAVRHLSSGALGTLITVNNKVKAKGGQLRLASIDPNIYEVFKITKLNKLFQIHDSAEQAKASFR